MKLGFARAIEEGLLADEEAPVCTQKIEREREKKKRSPVNGSGTYPITRFGSSDTDLYEDPIKSLKRILDLYLSDSDSDPHFPVSHWWHPNVVYNCENSHISV